MIRDLLSGFAIGALLVTVIAQRQQPVIERADEPPAGIVESDYTPAPVKPRPATPEWLRTRLEQRTDPLARPSAGTPKMRRDEYLTPFTSQ